MKIYHLLRNTPALKPVSGDQLNEINFIQALSRFAEVYYNDQLFQPDKPDFGLTKTDIELPKGKYDMYIVRNNPDIFYELPEPKIWIAYPYDERAFREATAVATFNETWRSGLEKYNQWPEAKSFFCNAFPNQITKTRKVINIGQVLDARFNGSTSPFKQFRYKARMGWGFTIGYFGRITDETLPTDYFQVLPELREKITDLNTFFAGSIRTDSVDKSVICAQHIPFEDMPDATAACDILLANEQSEANWAGSAKPLEAMAMGTPMVLSKRLSRVDQLGADYPLFYKDKNELTKLILKLYQDQSFVNDTKQFMLERSKLFMPDARASELEKLLRSLM